MENCSRLQTWANLKYPSQESLETANSLRTSPPALSVGFKRTLLEAP